MKLAFFGTGLVAAATFERLLRSRHTIAACVTAPDRAQGRGLDIQASAVKQQALAQQIACWQPLRLDAPFARQLAAVTPGASVVADYGLKIPGDVLRAPRLGTLGVHPSLLPKYRGAAPLQWAILRGEAMTGVTIFRLTETLDSGDILLQDMTAIRPDETAVELRDRLAAQGAELAVNALDLLERGDAQWHAQDERDVTFAPKLSKEDGRVDWSQSAETIGNRIRGLQPWPGAFTTWHGRALKLWRGAVAIGCATAAPGTVVGIAAEGFTVSAGAGGVQVTSVQLEGGRRMPAGDFCRGHSLRAGDKLG